MKNKTKRIFSTLFITLGVLAVLGAAVILGGRVYQEKKNREKSEHVLGVLESLMPPRTEGISFQGDFSAESMASLEAEGRSYMGILESPVLNLRWPVSCFYEEGRFTPYIVSNIIYGENVDSQFGELSQLSPGDEFIFTDINGTEYRYYVRKISLIHSETAPTADLCKDMFLAVSQQEKNSWLLAVLSQ